MKKQEKSTRDVVWKHVTTKLSQSICELEFLCHSHVNCSTVQVLLLPLSNTPCSFHLFIIVSPSNMGSLSLNAQDILEHLSLAPTPLTRIELRSQLYVYYLA